MPNTNVEFLDSKLLIKLHWDPNVTVDDQVDCVAVIAKGWYRNRKGLYYCGGRSGITSSRRDCIFLGKDTWQKMVQRKT